MPWTVPGVWVMLDGREREGKRKGGTKEGSSRFIECSLGGRKCINIILFASHNNLLSSPTLVHVRKLSQRALLKIVYILKATTHTKSG